MSLVQKSTNANKETKETMKVLETDKSIADNKIDSLLREGETNKEFRFYT